MISMSLYDHPAVYAALLRPEQSLVLALDQWCDEWLKSPMGSVMDPCCGPGSWLVPFRDRDVRVAGNDLSPGMIEEAKMVFGEGCGEWTVGDMRSLAFQSAPFDLAINMHSSVGHLPDLDAVLDHLISVRKQLRSGGFYFLGVVVNDARTIDSSLRVLFESQPTEMPNGGMAAVRYESVVRNGRRGLETIRLHLLTAGVDGCPQVLSEEYDLRSFRAAELRSVAAKSGFLVRAAYAMDEEGHPEVGLQRKCGDVTVILEAK
jgi:SAM-dependent methyltransferase